MTKYFFMYEYIDKKYKMRFILITPLNTMHWFIELFFNMILKHLAFPT